ncbi:MAG: DUF3109 family protein [Acidobacteria bacterium]|nr:DUF3109 family protein [Acidobacteriota bacterium]
MSDAARRLASEIAARLALRVRAVASRVLRPTYGRASLERCDATCCKGGVALSLAERDTILAHREAVAAAMRESPRPGVRAKGHDWFTVRARRDADFVDGRSVDTRVASGGCVFLREDRLCAVHVASGRVAGHPYAIKPAYCILFPVCVEKGKVDVCRGSYTKKPDCCSPIRGGTRTPLALFEPVTKLLSTTPPRAPRKVRGRGRA